MASPQPTPFVRFSKELYEAFYLNPPATVAGCRLWLWVLRWTWADFGKDETKERSMSQIAREVGLGKTTTFRTLESLIRCRYIKTGKEGGYAIQKDYDLWREDPKPRADHWANRPQQGALFTPGDNLGITSDTVPNVGTRPFPRGERNRSHVGNITVPTLGTPIRIENTVENREKGTPPKVLPNTKHDNARNRAQLGHVDYPPEGAPNWKILSFKLQDELIADWKDACAKERERLACRKGCGRDRASDAWPYCRPCTVCYVCDRGADGTRKFQSGPRGIICVKCATEVVEEF